MANSEGLGHALVTGGSNGIGAAVVARLSERGLAVTNIDLVAPHHDSTGRYVAVDCTDHEAVDTAVRTACDVAGPVTYVAVCHRVRGQFVSAIDIDPARLRQVWDVHVWGTLCVLTTVARNLHAGDREGSMVAISSTTAYGGWANQIDYGTAKAAIRQMTVNLAIEWGQLRIRVNCVAPGFTRTLMVQSMIDGGYDLEPVRARTPLGRIAEPDEIARTVEHLLLDATFTTGTCIPVDGGWTAVGK